MSSLVHADIQKLCIKHAYQNLIAINECIYSACYSELKTQSCHASNFVVNGATTGCHNDNREPAAVPQVTTKLRLLVLSECVV